MTKRRRQENVEPFIPINPTANISATMRAEARGEAPEVFENSDPKSNSIKLPPTTAEATQPTAVDVKPVGRKPEIAFVTPVQPPIDFKADFITAFSQSSGTVSYDSFQPLMSTQLEAMKVDARQIVHNPPEVQVAPEQNLLETETAVRQPSLEIYNDVEFHRALINPERLCPSFERLPPTPTRFRAVREQAFARLLMNELMDEYLHSGREDLDFHVEVNRQNGYPIVKAELRKLLVSIESKTSNTKTLQQTTSIQNPIAKHTKKSYMQKSMSISSESSSSSVD
ncbi:hypothetical protein M3Y94_01113800 [Aphelenchoides besseyi]|nr:hypothetical protein M3Y94_01113800 [Aphelenchoides besseyi]KAI6216786.1 hypothetical protein M3Y95_01257900 [Aphelenchoides besseyi]